MASRPDNILANVIANRAEALPDLEVLTIDGGGVRPDDVRTFRQLWGNALRMAGVLIDQGLQPGEHFALLMANHAEFVEAMIAASVVGAVFVPIDPRTKGDKLRFMLDNARCRGVIAADYALDNLADIRDERSELRWVIGLATDEGPRPLSDYPGVRSLHELLPQDAPALPIQATDPDGPMQLIFTSGTTGDPKGIVMTHRRFGVRIVEFYGAAEGGLTLNPLGSGPVGSIGKCVPSLQYRIVADDGRDCEPGELGELLFRHADGAPFKVEYFGNSEASAKKSADGWLHMGDVVHQDDNGWLYFNFRKGSGIRRNGEFVNSAFVEKVIAESPAVDDVFVYGVPARSGVPGEKDVVVAVVARPGGQFDPQVLFRACRARLEPGQVPQDLQGVGAIPKTASEKPQERFLVDALHAEPHRVHVER